MRIISQNGRIDFPYERVCLEVSDSGKIFAQGDIWGTDGNYIEAAKYSTEEKARKAMDMLHNTYVGTIYMQNVEMPEGGAEELKEMVKHGFGILSVIKDTDNVKFEALNICFQFPDDDEIEA